MKILPSWGRMILGLMILFSYHGTFGIPPADWKIDTSGTVTRVLDGDTFDALSVGRIRLADIDALRSGKPVPATPRPT